MSPIDVRGAGRDLLRIALVAPVAGPVGPGAGESIEQHVGLLAEGLLARGHEVTLYATADSESSAPVRAVHPQGYDAVDAMWDWYRAEAFHAAHAFEHATEHDVIHAHDFHFALPFSRLTPTPLIDTAHTEMPPEVLDELVRRAEVDVVVVSEHQRRSLAGRDRVSVIPHGVDFDGFPLSRRAEGGYLLFLGRMIADKGPEEAAAIARAAGVPLVLAGPEQDGYRVREAIDIDGERVRWVGAVDAVERNQLLGGAVALLFPLRYPEPFGLVLIEAMACGTPVLATDIGATAEIVEPGVTGFLADRWEDLAGHLDAAAALDRARVRRAARARFDRPVMIDRHEALYRQVAERGR